MKPSKKLGAFAKKKADRQKKEAARRKKEVPPPVRAAVTQVVTAAAIKQMQSDKLQKFFKAQVKRAVNGVAKKIPLPSPAVMKNMATLVRKGVPPETAARSMGVLAYQFTAWMIQGAEHMAQGVDSPCARFAAAMDVAMAQWEANAIIGMEGADKTASTQWLLARHIPSRYGVDKNQKQAQNTAMEPVAVPIAPPPKEIAANAPDVLTELRVLGVLGSDGTILGEASEEIPVETGKHADPVDTQDVDPATSVMDELQEPPEEEDVVVDDPVEDSLTW